MTVTIRFLGAAETVTGSRYLVESDAARVLVDCGLFQGWKRLRARNWTDPRFDPASVDAVVLTHAHIDHTGYVPRLRKLGFRGRVHCTPGTQSLLKILWPDSGYLQEEQARLANKWGRTKHQPALPLYTRAEAEASLGALSPTPYYETFDVAPGVTGRYTRAGHILGSACLSLSVGGVTIAFTGDVGRPVDPIMLRPDPLGPADYLVTESTYGDRRHPPEAIHDTLARVVNAAVEEEGTILVPAFAVGRAQHLLHIVAELKGAGRIPDIPVYLDSPMAITATGIFCQHEEDHRLSRPECHVMCETARYARSPEESKAIDASSGPMIVISASGMATGGRILHHLRRFLPEERNRVLFVGYQASGTRGRLLVDGTDELKIHGQYVTVRARIEQVHGLSAHADYRELLDWLATSELTPRQVFVTHGEPGAADAFRRRLGDELGWIADVPEDGQRYRLQGGG